MPAIAGIVQDANFTGDFIVTNGLPADFGILITPAVPADLAASIPSAGQLPDQIHLALIERRAIRPVNVVESDPGRQRSLGAGDSTPTTDSPDREKRK